MTDIQNYIQRLTDELRDIFGDHLVYVGFREAIYAGKPQRTAILTSWQ